MEFLVFGIKANGSDAYLAGAAQGASSEDALKRLLERHKDWVSEYKMYFVHPCTEYGRVTNGDGKHKALFTATSSGIEINCVF